jgi:protease-4
MSDVNERNPNQGRPQMPQYPPPQRRRSSNWWIPLVIIGAIILLFVVFVAVIATNFKSAFEPEQVVIKENSVLTITLDGSLPEKTESNPFAFFAGENSNPATFWETLKAIELAKDDDKIKGIYLKPSLSGVSYSKLLEFHEALDEFKKSGKFIYGFLEVGSENQYFAMLPADTLFSPKEGMIEFNGFNATSMFFKDMLKKIGVEYHVEHFEDFKSAANSFVETGYTDSARYQTRVLLEQRSSNFVNAIEKYRGIDKATIQKLLEYGYITADSLYKHGLLDVLVAETTVKEFVKARALGQEFENPLDIQNAELVDYEESGDEKIKFVSVNSYLAGDRPSVDESEIHDPDKRIAIINAVGPIVSMSTSAFGGESEIVSGQLVRHLREARQR